MELDQSQVDDLIQRRARKRAKRRRAQMRAAQAAVLRVRAVFVNACDAGWKRDEALALQHAFVAAVEAGDEEQALAIEQLSTLTPDEAVAAANEYDAAVAAATAESEAPDVSPPAVEAFVAPEDTEPAVVADATAEVAQAPADPDDDVDPFTDWVDDAEAHAATEAAPAVVVESQPVDVAAEADTAVSAESVSAEPEPAPAVEKPRRKRRSRKSA